jgi:hypothetical protein
MHSKKITCKSVIIVGLEAEELKAEGYDSRMFRLMEQSYQTTMYHT